MKTFKFSNLLIGADIELFLKQRETDEIISAEPFIKGTKDEPFRFDPDNNMFGLSLDNVLCEFGIPPVTKAEDWLGNIRKALNYINSTIPETLCTVAQPAAILDPKYLATENALLFGCEPDFNVYLREPNERPQADNLMLRSAGGHIHVGYDEATTDTPDGLEACEAIIKSLDLFVGLPSVLQEPDNERKKLYGKAGAFRFKPYGVEYRTVSNYYLSEERLTQWVFNNTLKAIDFLRDGGYEEMLTVGETVREAINTNNKVLAGNIVRQFQIELA